MGRRRSLRQHEPARVDRLLVARRHVAALADLADAEAATLGPLVRDGARSPS